MMDRVCELDMERQDPIAVPERRGQEAWLPLDNTH